MLVGRSTEMEDLDGRLASVRTDGGGRVLVLGRPGMGTTALLRAFAQRAEHHGAIVRDLSVDDLPATPTPTPTVLLLDDADTVPEPDLRRLEAWARTVPAGCLAVVGGRSFGPLPRVLAEWPRVLLRPLGVEDSVTLLRQALGPDAPIAVVHELAARLAGNPRALCEVPGLLADPERLGMRPLPRHLPVPASLDAAWGRLWSDLPDRARAAAVDLAVVGPRADLLHAMAEQAGWSDGDLDLLVDTGLAAHEPDGIVDFVDPVARDAVLGRAPTSLVRARHRHAGERATALGLPPRVVAEHLAQSVATADEETAAALAAQARRAEELDQLAVASDTWQASARLSPSASQRVERAMRGLRLVIANGLDYAGTDALLDLLAGVPMEAECALWIEWLHTLKAAEVDPDAALAAQFTAIQRARVAAPDTLRALLWDAAMNAWSLGDAEAGLQAAREYLDVDRTLGPSPTAVEPPWAGTALLAAGLFQAGEVAAAMVARETAIAAAADVDPEGVSFNRLLSVVFLDDLLLDASPAAAQRLLVAQQRAPERSVAAACLLGIAAWRARARGDWATARTLLRRGLMLAGTTGATGPQLGMGALAVELAGLQGRDEDLARDSARVRDQAQRTGDRRRRATVDRALGLRALADGRLDEAVVDLAAAADVPFLGRGLRDGILPARVDLVEAHVRQGDDRAARTRAAQIAPVLAAMGEPAARALELRVRALLAEGDDATSLFRAALAAHAEADEPFERARTSLLLGEHLRRLRMPAAARPHLLEAARTAEELGARPWWDRAQRELRAAGGRPACTVDLSGLTAQERAVAEAVASGQSNREVAERLFLSPRTVEYHLSSVYRKLGLHGRAALAHQLGHVDA